MLLPPVGVAPFIVKLWPLQIVFDKGLIVLITSERLLIWIVSLVAGHTLLLILQIILVMPMGRLVIADVALLGCDTMAVEGLVTVQVPIPFDGVFPVRVVETLLQISLSGPAFAGVAAPETVITI